MTPCTGAGQYQDEKGASTCKICAPGFECTQTTSTKCTPQSYAQSYYCQGSLASPDTLVRTLCPAGTYNF